MIGVEIFLTENMDFSPVNIIVGLLKATNLWLPNEKTESVEIGVYPPTEES